jgi:hypothetical protein
MQPIQARFVPAGRYTEYSIFRVVYAPKDQMTVTWTLHLELVDPAGAADPSEPGAKAGVDLGCTNAGVGLPGHPVTATVGVGHPAPTFTWHHPDAADSVPAGLYHCDHLDMGPRGHQGLITVVVNDGKWECTATYKGTNDSAANSVKDGTASEPKCRKVA